MKIRNIASMMLRNVRNIPGWRTNRKIIVIESDDWGSIRMCSKKTYKAFLDRGYHVYQSNYNRLDGLESNDDMAALFDILESYSDKNGRHPVITANCVIANPDFDKIAESGYTSYYYEHFSKTLGKYPNHNRVLDFYKKGIAGRFFYPQFHGREHLNVNRWVKALQSKDPEIRFTFSHRTTFSGKEDYSFMEALDFDSPQEISLLKDIITDGLRLFRHTFGYSSTSFIASCYTWPEELEEVLYNNGIKYIQGVYSQSIPQGGFNKYKNKYHYMGQKNVLGQIYLVRNSSFEPSLFYKKDWVNYTLSSINNAFLWHKPAIISSHRINYIGYLVEANRTKNLTLLENLLKAILEKWPDVEFMTSDELGNLIAASVKEK
jgi:hypothetical protein